MDQVTLFLLCVSVFVGLTSAVTPTITNPGGNANLREKQSVDKCVYQLVTSPAAFSCAQTTSTFPIFALQKRSGDTDYCVYFLNGQGTIVPPSYIVSFTCDDGDGNTDSSFAKIDIIPNAPPTFDDGTSVTKSVDASTIPNGGTLFNVATTDSDGDALVYSLDTEFAEFQIDPANGNLLAKKDFSKVTTPSFNFKVQITDRYSALVEQTVTVNLNNMNTAPQITNLVNPLSFPEDTPPGTVLYTCTHDDPGSVSIDFVVSPAIERQIFGFSGPSCIISLKASEILDFERTPTMTLTLTLDDGVSSNVYPITFNVLNVNEPPSFAPITYTMDIDEVGAFPVTPAIQSTFVVWDKDAGDTKTFTLAPGTYDTYFNIDGSSGALTLIKELDYDAGITQAEVTVIVTDSGGLTATTTLTVNVADINDNDPEFSAGRTLYISPKTPVGNIGQVVATDKDSKDNAKLTYTMVSDSSGGRFLVQPDGSVYLQTLVTEAQRNDVYSVVIRATDGGTTPRSGDTTVTIVFDPPPVITSLPNIAYHNEDISSPTNVFKIDVTDNDTFACVADDVRPATTVELFIVEKVGTDWSVLYTGREKLSYVATPIYYVDVICTDSNGGKSIKSTLTIQVIQNQPPTVTCTTLVPVDASTTTIGTKVHTVVATDTETLIYTMTVLSSPGTFNIGPTGDIFAQKQMIRETVSQYIGVVTVTDGYNYPSCTVTLTMTNTNEAPVFDLPRTESKAEDLAAGSLITDVTISDAMECDPTTFTMTVVPDAETHKFEATLTGKVVSLKLAAGQELDHDTVQDYEFYFKARDGCLESQTYPLYLTVTNVNEPPLFLNGDHFVVHFNEIGSGPADIGCNGWDPDVLDSHTLTLEGNEANMFSISNPATCTLTPLVQLDLDKAPVVPDIITLTMKLIDAAGLSSTATIKVYVDEVNDLDPVCDQAAFTLSDVFNGDTVGRSLGRVTATDDDRGVVNKQLTYSIVAPSSGTNVVDMKSDGEFTVVADPDAQFVAVGSVLDFTVKVTDGGNPPRSTTCQVNIQYIYTTTPPTPPTQPPTAAPTAAATTTGSGTGTTGSGTSAVDQALNNPVVIGLIAAVAGLAALGAIAGLAFCCKKCGPCSGSDATKPTKRYDYRNNGPSRLQSRGDSPNKASSTNIRTVSEVKPQAFNNGPTSMRYL